MLRLLTHTCVVAMLSWQAGLANSNPRNHAAETWKSGVISSSSDARLTLHFEGSNSGPRNLLETDQDSTSPTYGAHRGGASRPTYLISPTCNSPSCYRPHAVDPRMEDWMIPFSFLFRFLL